MRRSAHRLLIALGWLVLILPVPGLVAQNADAGSVAHADPAHVHMAGSDGMQFDAGGLVMNANESVLPRDCPELSGDYQFSVRVGRNYADAYPGTVFGMSQHEYRVPPCSRVTVTLINEDEVRHQWMLHGLPLYLYPQGMFHLEAAGGQSRTGTFIVPSEDRTYLVHCDMTQHMEKGMKGQLVVGSGSGDLWSVPGVSRQFRQSRQVTVLSVSLVVSMAAMSFLVLAFLGKRNP
ncbi:MAG: multicopper oxidase domain-containing protein [Gammaproteobacteria bacterium]|nr:multicopper oxidase domain-containing protein [Pseudomonadales bacterium]MCP5348186.1 multicopper oxidase domain-containing protein [Pseudomonadales bacterium]